ncbi:MAG: alcohol dehydrogenase catalytic domain-containing protein [Planctomycetota bacterium]|nr:alcohol dehydrogenase catalytic domain-containing protein [Planctomycetota bacterium]
MKALVYTAPNTLEMRDVDLPQPASAEALLRVQAAGICGSDMGGFLGHSLRRKPPLVLGHELVGTVVSCDSPSFQPGTRVCVNPVFSCLRCDNCLAGRQNICSGWKLLGMDDVQGAYAEYVLAPVSALHQVPESLPDEVACLPEPVACGVHLLRLASKQEFGSVAIFGAGTQGTLIQILARLLGYRKIFVSDVNKERLAVSEKLGADVVVHAGEKDVVETIRSETGGRGADLTIDAVGRSVTRQNAIAACKDGGEVLLLGMAEATTEVDFMSFLRREVCLKTSFAYSAADFRRAVELVVGGAIDIEPWIEVRPLEDGQAAFEKMIGNPGNTIKLVLKP